MSAEQKILQSKKLWEKVYAKYPGIDAVLEQAAGNASEDFDIITTLNEKYPVEGYEWDCDPNELGAEGICPFFLMKLS